MCHHYRQHGGTARCLTDTLITFAAETEYITVSQLFLHLSGHGVDIITDQSDRTGRENTDSAGMHQVIDLLDSLLQFLLSTEYDVVILHIG